MSDTRTNSVNNKYKLYILYIVNTTIRLDEKTKMRLINYGKYNQTMDDIINLVLDKLEKK